MPAGLTAFRVNVAYDMLRAAVQSGEFVVEADQRQLALLNSARTPTPPSAEEAPAPSTPGSVFADAGDAARSEVTRLSQADVLQGGLSEAMGPWLKVRLRAEVRRPYPAWPGTGGHPITGPCARLDMSLTPATADALHARCGRSIRVLHRHRV